MLLRSVLALTVLLPFGHAGKSTFCRGTFTKRKMILKASGVHWGDSYSDTDDVVRMALNERAAVGDMDFKVFISGTMEKLRRELAMAEPIVPDSKKAIISFRSASARQSYDC